MPEEVEMLDFGAFKERYEKVPVEEYPNRVREAVPEPVVSVHLLTYNHAEYVEEAIESVLMQEVDFPMEIVLGDDDSSDGTREICIEYAKQYPDLIRLQLHHRENNIHLHGGPTHLFQYWYNTFSARGEYIAILSGDDYWTDPLKLHKQVSLLEENKDYVLSYHDGCVVDASGKVKNKSQLPNKRKHDQSSMELMKAPFLITASLLFRNIVKKMPDSIVKCVNEDIFLVGFIGQFGRGKFQQEVEVSAYREHREASWNSLPWIQMKKRLLVTTKELKKYFRKIKKHEIYNHHKKMLLTGMYSYSLRKKEYKNASSYWFKSISLMVKEGEFGKLLLFLKHSMTMFLGSLRLSKNE
ncbi:hypothetical protein CRI94_14005 [Longibacter salinarum]|uniref:Glycosyltransferase 2-like domain-containing protein n=1 Tax=Longibacter salinarum TaxID=1850348 RepID=A0A2A8CV90_9BACT|nr:glycosyltransferase [Longibacter salinarum]PEN12625.1 hypothetical protein CRI94_14005 [Longibacter salinarum]